MRFSTWVLRTASFLRCHLAVGQNPVGPSEHPNPTTRMGSKRGEFTEKDFNLQQPYARQKPAPKWDPIEPWPENLVPAYCAAEQIRFLPVQSPGIPEANGEEPLEIWAGWADLLSKSARGACLVALKGKPKATGLPFLGAEKNNNTPNFDFLFVFYFFGTCF